MLSTSLCSFLTSFRRFRRFNLLCLGALRFGVQPICQCAHVALIISLTYYGDSHLSIVPDFPG